MLVGGDDRFTVDPHDGQVLRAVAADQRGDAPGHVAPVLGSVARTRSPLKTFLDRPPGCLGHQDRRTGDEAVLVRAGHQLAGHIGVAAGGELQACHPICGRVGDLARLVDRVVELLGLAELERGLPGLEEEAAAERGPVERVARVEEELGDVLPAHPLRDLGVSVRGVLTGSHGRPVELLLAQLQEHCEVGGGSALVSVGDCLDEVVDRRVLLDLLVLRRLPGVAGGLAACRLLLLPVLLLALEPILVELADRRTRIRVAGLGREAVPVKLEPVTGLPPAKA